MKSILLQIIRNLWQSINFQSSQEYWSERYATGGNSGAGSYGRFARFKADTINEWVREYSIHSLVELGCGDGNQATLFKVPRYIGLDVVPEAVRLSSKRLQDKDGFECHYYDPGDFHPEASGFRSDAALSLDVIYHLVEDNVYELYLAHLFRLADRYVIVYSSNKKSSRIFTNRHVRHRRFVDDVSRIAPEWDLVQRISNPYPSKFFGMVGTFADFYLFRRTVSD